jgi:hypothetical protein
MFISEEVYFSRIDAARAKYKPWVPTHESTIQKHLNEIPGLICDNVIIKEHPDKLMLTYQFKMQCTKQGFFNYSHFFSDVTESLDQTYNLITSFINTMRKKDPNNQEECLEMQTRLRLDYCVCVKKHDELPQCAFNTSTLMIAALKRTVTHLKIIGAKA